MDMTGIRQVKNGKWEAVAGSGKDRFYKTFETPEEAFVWRKNTMRAAELNRPKSFCDVVNEYMTAENVQVAPSASVLLGQIVKDKLLTTAVASIDYDWSDTYVSSLKKLNNTPGTIRKKVSTLAVVLDWHLRRTRSTAGNPLRNMDKGYSAYKKGGPVNITRDRRLAPGEYELLCDTISGTYINHTGKPFRCSDREHLLMLFKLIVNTAMRLREAYGIRRNEIDFEQRVIVLPRTKNGRVREVPIRAAVLDDLKAYVESTAVEADDPIFPFWGGSEDEKVLRDVTNRMSKRFTSIFDYAGLGDITEHDLRHEGTCRWLELKGSDGTWVFRSEEVRRITGHLTTAAFDRYTSFRGSELSEKLARALA